MSNYPDDYTLSEAISENRAAEEQARFELLMNWAVERVEEGKHNAELIDFLLYDADSSMTKDEIINAVAKPIAQQELKQENSI